MMKNLPMKDQIILLLTSLAVVDIEPPFNLLKIHLLAEWYSILKLLFLNPCLLRTRYKNETKQIKKNRQAQVFYTSRWSTARSNRYGRFYIQLETPTECKKHLHSPIFLYRPDGF